MTAVYHKSWLSASYAYFCILSRAAFRISRRFIPEHSETRKRTKVFSEDQARIAPQAPGQRRTAPSGRHFVDVGASIRAEMCLTRIKRAE